MTVTVTCVDDPPVAVDDSATVPEDAAATAILVLANDTDPDGGPDDRSRRRRNRINGTVAITGGGTGLTYAAERELLQRPAGDGAGLVHVHAERRLDRDGDRHGHVRERRAELHRGAEPG